MKKSLLVLATCLTISTAFADGEKTVKTKIEKEPISKGFFIHLGLGFPAYKYVGTYSLFGTTSATRSLGPQINLEIGNQWYFVKNDNFGIGLKVGWLQLGYGMTTEPAYTSKTGTFDLRLLKFGPQFSIALGDKSALDTYVDVAPTLIISANGQSGVSYGTVSSGVLFAPGLRLRLGKFALGADVSLGRLSTKYTNNNSNNSTTINVSPGTYKTSYIIPRVYIGLKF